MDRDDIAEVIERTAREINVNSHTQLCRAEVSMDEARRRTTVADAFFQLATEFRKGFPV